MQIIGLFLCQKTGLFPVSSLKYFRVFCSTDVRVRFAPSPTGYLHLGGLRTALYNYLFAKSKNGAFILRIEDTDQSRVVEGAIGTIESDLKWFGIHFDEGPSTVQQAGPYIQSQRLHIYQEYVKKLLENQSAYYCFCTESRLNLIRKEALRLRQIPKYDNNCRILTQKQIDEKLSQGQSYCIRFKLSNARNKFNDLIYGPITYNITQNEGDPIIMKSDRYPTYHFANVIDDHFMNISHVLRGIEWQISTVKHLLLYDAFNWKPPIFGHIPLLLNSDGKKLSKRQNDVKVEYFRNHDIFPMALINFVILCGGGFDENLLTKPRIYLMDDLIKKFDIRKIGMNSTKLMFERLQEFNQLELERQMQNESSRKILVEQLRNKIEKHFNRNEPQIQVLTDEQYLTKILKWAQNRIFKLDDLLTQNYLFLWFISTKKNAIIQQNRQLIDDFLNEFENFDIGDENRLSSFFKEFCKRKQVPYANFMCTLRRILTGFKEGPSVVEIIQILGKEDTLRRLYCDESCQFAAKIK